jgi:hypothetical protein
LFIRIFVPEEFHEISDTLWSRRDDIVADPRKPLSQEDKNKVKVLYYPDQNNKLTKVISEKDR